MEWSVFYVSNLVPEQVQYTFDEANSKYCIQVLRKKVGDSIYLADGLGNRYEARIEDDHRKKCVVAILKKESLAIPSIQVTIAIAFTKNTARMEWFLEKAMEIGVHRIVPLLTHRGEKEKLKMERLNQILISGMLQSKQWFLPILEAPSSLESWMLRDGSDQKFIAHCLPDHKNFLLTALQPQHNVTVLIGPEGDFTPAEIEGAIKNGYQPVSLGDTRLRTETAGMVACTLIAAANQNV
jgi:16S rRNA (uracil1498-N3)-methyltransferase